MRPPCIAALALLAGGLAAAAAADDVLLTNGKSFTGVIAEVAGESVRIQLPFGGVITLPQGRVERIDRAESPFAGFRQRRRELAARGDATVADWLELALWARRQGFEQGYRDAVLTAARRDPEAAEIAPALRDLGYAFDERLREWVPRDEAMARNGLVRFRGAWVAAEERDRSLAEEAEQRRERADRARLDRLAAAVEAVAVADLARSLARASEPVAGVVTVPYSVVFWPALPVLAIPAPVPAPAPSPPTAPSAAPARRSGPPTFHRGIFANPYGGSLGPPELIPGRLNPGAAPPPGRLATAD